MHFLFQRFSNHQELYSKRSEIIEQNPASPA
jgi:hypothetical protein